MACGVPAPAGPGPCAVAAGAARRRRQRWPGPGRGHGLDALAGGDTCGPRSRLDAGAWCRAPDLDLLTLAESSRRCRPGPDHGSCTSQARQAVPQGQIDVLVQSMQLQVLGTRSWGCWRMVPAPAGPWSCFAVDARGPRRLEPAAAGPAPPDPGSAGRGPAVRATAPAAGFALSIRAGHQVLQVGLGQTAGATRVLALPEGIGMAVWCRPRSLVARAARGVCAATGGRSCRCSREQLVPAPAGARGNAGAGAGHRGVCWAGWSLAFKVGQLSGFAQCAADAGGVGAVHGKGLLLCVPTAPVAGLGSGTA